MFVMLSQNTKTNENAEVHYHKLLINVSVQGQVGIRKSYWRIVWVLQLSSKGFTYRIYIDAFINILLTSSEDLFIRY